MRTRVLVSWLCMGLLLCSAALDKNSNKLADLKAVEDLKPLKKGENVFFWRPQKVGSSTLLSILMSYGYRYNFLPKRKSASNAFCRRFAKCAIAQENHSTYNVSYAYLEKYVTQRIPGSTAKGQLKKKDLDLEKASNLVPFKVSLSHEICNIDAAVVAHTMQCTFQRNPEPQTKSSNATEVRELFMLRDPLNRAISAYYFWGELYKMKHGMKVSSRDRAENMQKERDAQFNNRQLQHVITKGEVKLGQSNWKDPIVVHGQHFQYHGQESSAPPANIALRYAEGSVYKPGMPGPSYTWSAFADNVQDALEIVQSDRICTIVLERLPESLVVAAHYLGWSLADVVVTKHRKALSTHPKAADWPAEAIRTLRKQLNAPEHGEYLIYNASVAKLDQRIGVLNTRGVDVPGEVAKLTALQKRVSEVSVRCCLPLFLSLSHDAESGFVTLDLPG